MRSMWTTTPARLDRFAKTHIEYEVRMLLQQYGRLERRWHEVRRGKRLDLDVDGQALLEAVLVHLRLLDDFLGDPEQDSNDPPQTRDRDDVWARHWVTGWRSKRFLTKRPRDRVNAQVAHLTARRRVPGVQPDELPNLVVRCCLRLRNFFEAVEKHDRKRSAAFAKPRRYVDDFLNARGL